MEQGLRLIQKPELRQRLSAQQLRLVHLLGLSAVEFEQRVRDELDDNPAMEIEEPDPNDESMPAIIRTSNEYADYLPQYGNALTSEQSQQSQIADKSTGMQPDLLQQISVLPLTTDKERNLCTYLVGMLDGDGYLRREFADIVNDVLFAYNIETTPQEWNAALQIIQTLDPAGIGARNLRECLLLQLRRKPQTYPGIALAIQILEHHFDNFVHKKYVDITTKTKTDRQELDAAIAEIRKLNPSPGGLLATDTADMATTIVPDFIVENECGELIVTLASKHLPKLLINKRYNELSEHSNKDNRQFAEQKLGEASWFINAVKQRARTLNLVINVIVAHQQKFFLTGDDADILPLTQYAVAQKTGYDKSTISRAINNKYIQTSFGIYPLKHFFAVQAESNDGNILSVQHLKNAIAEIIDSEDKRNPLRDVDITELLRARRFEVSRRTVAKYREKMNIPTIHLRRVQ
jgi:RNA polymerase sigma-54 factor